MTKWERWTCHSREKGHNTHRLSMSPWGRWLYVHKSTTSNSVSRLQCQHLCASQSSLWCISARGIHYDSFKQRGDGLANAMNIDLSICLPIISWFWDNCIAVGSGVWQCVEDSAIIVCRRVCLKNSIRRNTPHCESWMNFICKKYFSFISIRIKMRLNDYGTLVRAGTLSSTAAHLISLLGLISTNILRWKRKHPAPSFPLVSPEYLTG